MTNVMMTKRQEDGFVAKWGKLKLSIARDNGWQQQWMFDSSNGIIVDKAVVGMV